MNEKQTKVLISGLKFMNDSSGVHYLLERLELLSRWIDETVDGEVCFQTSAGQDGDIVTYCYWQRQILDQVRTILNSQDAIIGKLGNVAFEDEKEDKPRSKPLKADHRSLEKLRSLESLFVFDNLLYGDHVDPEELETWAVANDFDFDAIRGLLGIEHATA